MLKLYKIYVGEGEKGRTFNHEILHLQNTNQMVIIYTNK